MRSEHVIASSWRALVLPPCPRHSISTLDEICGRFLPSRSRQCLPLRVTLSASLPGPQVWRACDRGLVPLPWPNDAQNKREPSEDDCFAAPTAVGIHQGSSHGEC